MVAARRIQTRGDEFANSRLVARSPMSASPEELQLECAFLLKLLESVKEKYRNKEEECLSLRDEVSHLRLQPTSFTPKEFELLEEENRSLRMAVEQYRATIVGLLALNENTAAMVSGSPLRETPAIPVHSTFPGSASPVMLRTHFWESITPNRSLRNPVVSPLPIPHSRIAGEASTSLVRLPDIDLDDEDEGEPEERPRMKVDKDKDKDRLVNDQAEIGPREEDVVELERSRGWTTDTFGVEAGVALDQYQLERDRLHQQQQMLEKAKEKERNRRSHRGSTEERKQKKTPDSDASEKIRAMMWDVKDAAALLTEGQIEIDELMAQLRKTAQASQKFSQSGHLLSSSNMSSTSMGSHRSVAASTRNRS